MFLTPSQTDRGQRAEDRERHFVLNTQSDRGQRAKDRERYFVLNAQSANLSRTTHITQGRKMETDTWILIVFINWLSVALRPQKM